MKPIAGLILSALLFATTTVGCGALGETEEGDGDAEITPAALKMKPALLLEAGSATQRDLGVYAWEVSMDQHESMVLGLAKSGKRVVTARSSKRDRNRDVGRISFHDGRRPLKFVFDKAANRLKVSGGPAPSLLAILEAYGRDEAAGKVLKKYDARGDVLTCGACALGTLGCAGTVAGCVAASSATGGLAGLACAARTVATCGAAAIACYVCVTETIGGPSVTVSEEGGDNVSVCLRNDPCWCDVNPNECYSPES